MQIKNTLALLTALTAGSAVARTHGHARRHQHLKERALGDEVTATIDGQVVHWLNNYAGPTGAPADPLAAVPTAPASTAPSPVAPAPSAVSAAAPAVSSSVSNLATGFGKSVASTGSGIFKCGNTGEPYGSTIIQIKEQDVPNYKYTIKLDGSKITEDYKVGAWNKCGPTGALDGFFQQTLPLEFDLPAGQTAYIAIDDDVQGGLVANPGSIPRTSYGAIAGIWVEFDFGNSDNGGYSGFDASCIVAQNAGIASQLQGLSVCLADGQQCSSIGNGCNVINNAYDAALAAVGGVGGNVAPGPVSLVATLGWN
jgi:hypothetical protein